MFRRFAPVHVRSSSSGRTAGFSASQWDALLHLRNPRQVSAIRLCLNTAAPAFVVLEDSVANRTEGPIVSLVNRNRAQKAR